MSRFAIFRRFLRFGALAFGGPVAQIGMLRKELVDDEEWIPRERFGRVLGVYQVLPGPEAHELCVHFGMLKGGRLGGFLAGLGFMLPGFVLMLGASVLYWQAIGGEPWQTAGLAGAGLLAAASAGAGPAAIALIVRGGYRIGKGVLTHPVLWMGFVLAATAEVLEVPFWIGLLAAGLLNELRTARGAGRLAVALPLVPLLALIGLAVVLAWPDAAPAPVPQPGLLIAIDLEPPSLLLLFWIGLRGGLLTFGGAYTAIPFVRGLAVGGPTGFMSDAVFLDGLAIGAVLPAPLVIFSTFVGYMGGGLPGALATTAGMFLPAFAFTLLGFDVIHRIIENQRVHAFLDGVTAGVIGVVAVTVVRLGQGALIDARAWIAAGLASAIVWGWRSPWASPMAIVAGVAVALTLR